MKPRGETRHSLGPIARGQVGIVPASLRSISRRNLAAQKRRRIGRMDTTGRVRGHLEPARRLGGGVVAFRVVAGSVDGQEVANHGGGLWLAAFRSPATSRGGDDQFLCEYLSFLHTSGIDRRTYCPVIKLNEFLQRCVLF